jgi:hypothetical protein
MDEDGDPSADVLLDFGGEGLRQAIDVLIHIAEKSQSASDLFLTSNIFPTWLYDNDVFFKNFEKKIESLSRKAFG